MADAKKRAPNRRVQAKKKLPKGQTRDGSNPDKEDKPGKGLEDASAPARRGGSDPDQDDGTKSGKGL